MSSVYAVPLTPEARARAVARVYARSPRRLRLTPGHLRYIAGVDARREAAVRAAAGRPWPADVVSARPGEPAP